MDKFPINNDADYTHTITDKYGVVVDISLYDGYAVHWFYKTKQGNRVSIGKYATGAATGYTVNLEGSDETSGECMSHIQRSDMDIPEGVKIFWQFYSQTTDADHDVTFNAATEEIEAGVSVNADEITETLP